MLELLVKGPVIVFCLMLVTVVVAFGYSNRLSAPPGDGMNVDLLSNTVTAALGLLAVTTNVIIAYLFAMEARQS